jgi:hypothetical protein
MFVMFVTLVTGFFIFKRIDRLDALRPMDPHD